MDEVSVNPDLPSVEMAAQEKIGVQLRAAREAKGLSVADVAAQIRLAPRQIDALEAADMTNLPELPFVRGFVRSYAKLLGLDAQQLLALLPDPYASNALHLPASVEVVLDAKRLSRQQNRRWLIALVGIAVLVAIWMSREPATSLVVQPEASLATVEQAIELPAVIETVHAVSASVEATDALAAALVAPIAAQVKAPLPASEVPVVVPVLTPLASASSVPMSTTGSQLRLTFSADAWAKITDSNGRLLSSRHHQAGGELNLKSVGPYQIVLDNASAVKIYRHGKLLDLTSYINKDSDLARFTVE